MHGRTDGLTDKPKLITPIFFFEKAGDNKEGYLSIMIGYIRLSVVVVRLCEIVDMYYSRRFMTLIEVFYEHSQLLFR